MCGDCDNSGRITVAELVRAVGNALEPPTDECAECFTSCFPTLDDCPCPRTCTEFFEADGLICAASICVESDEQVRRCVKHFDALGRCSQVLP